MTDLPSPALRLSTTIAATADETSEVPVDILHWLLVLVPIVVLLLLYVWGRWKGAEAAPIGLLLVAGIAVWAFQMPLEDLAASAARGVWDALPIALIIFAALVLYRIGESAGAFHALRKGVERITENRVFLVLSFGWVFTSFTQASSTSARRSSSPHPSCSRSTCVPSTPS